MPGFATLTDTFDDGVRDPVLWSGSYGDIVESGGRARVPCSGGYAAYASAAVYSLAGSQVVCRVYAPAAGGATAEALAEVLVLTSVGGTDAGFSLNAATGQLKCLLRVGYADPAEVVLTYTATAHAWLRLRESAGVLYWDTSPDGQTWTNRRSGASPAWASDVNLSVVLAGHRNNGIDDVSEFDNFNLARGSAVSDGFRAGTAVSHVARTGTSISGG